MSRIAISGAGPPPKTPASAAVDIPLDDAQRALLADLTAKQQRNLNCLGDPNRSTRRRALLKFVKEFRAGGPGGNEPIMGAR